MSESMNELNLTKNISLLHSPTFVHKIRTILTLDYGQCPMDSYEKKSLTQTKLNCLISINFFEINYVVHHITFYSI